MADAPSPQVDPRRVRLGLIMLAVTVLVALAIAMFVDNPMARLIMAAIIVFAIGRTFVLVRSARQGRITG
jgi:hypothetical protein